MNQVLTLSIPVYKVFLILLYAFGAAATRGFLSRNNSVETFIDHVLAETFSLLWPLYHILYFVGTYIIFMRNVFSLWEARNKPERAPRLKMFAESIIRFPHILKAIYGRQWNINVFVENVQAEVAASGGEDEGDTEMVHAESVQTIGDTTIYEDHYEAPKRNIEKAFGHEHSIYDPRTYPAIPMLIGNEAAPIDLREVSGKQVFYRVGSLFDGSGLWYTSTGGFTGNIHKSNLSLRELTMPYDDRLTGYQSATFTIQELLIWFSYNDIIKLQEEGYGVMMIEASDYFWYQKVNESGRIEYGHWAINPESYTRLTWLRLSYDAATDTFHWNRTNASYGVDQ